MNNPKFSIVCDTCGMQIDINSFSYREVELRQGPVKVQYFTCPKCDEEYITNVFDEESNRLRAEWKAMDREFDKLKKMKNGPEKDEAYRQLINERDQRKRNMYAYNNRLKKRTIKELKRHDKK